MMRPPAVERAAPSRPDAIPRPAARRTVVFFGAGEGGRQALAHWPVARWPVSCFVDNDRTKWGSTLGGLPVEHPRVLETERYGQAFVVVTSQRYEEIAGQLEAMGLIWHQDFSAPVDASNLLARHAPFDLRSRRAVILNLEEPWFGLDYDRLRELCADDGVGYVAAPLARHRTTGATTFGLADHRAVRCHGIPLYDACLFDLCVACGVTPDRIAPANPSHWSAIVDHLRCAAALATVATTTLDEVRPDVVVVPQGHTTAAAVYRYAAVLRGIRVLALENSLNSTRLVWDDVAGIAVNKIPARHYYWRWADLVDDAAAAAHLQSYLSSIKRAKSADHQSPGTPWPGPEAPGRTVLYLANVLTDASVLFNSRVGSQTDAIKATARWALEHDCTFILKTHPRERPDSPVLRRRLPRAEYSYAGLTVRALQEDAEFWRLVSTSDRCVIDADNRFDTYDLIRRSDVCVTVCSQAGMEALMHGKEAVVLGDAYYGGLGFTHDVHGLEPLGAALGAALSAAGRRADARTVARFFYIFDRLYCVEKSAEGVAALIRRTVGSAPLPVLPATA